MKHSKNWFCAVICMITLFCSYQIEACFSINGRIQSKKLNFFVGGTLDNNGELIGTETANINCETLSGKGVIDLLKSLLKQNYLLIQGLLIAVVNVLSLQMPILMKICSKK